MATLCFDLDGTLCTATGGDYDRAEPNGWAIERVNQLSRAGHHIIIWTARGTATGIDWETVTRAQLARWGLSYDELRFGKPSADVFVDDRAVHADTWRFGDAFAPPGLRSGAARGRDPFAEAPVAAPAGIGFSEMGRTFGGRTFKLSLHAARITALGSALGIRGLPAEDQICAAVSEAVARCETEEDACFTIRLAAPGHLSRLDGWQGASEARLEVDCRPLSEAVAGLRPMVLPGPSPAVRAGFESSAGQSWPLYQAPSGEVSAGLGACLLVVVAGELIHEPLTSASDVAAQWVGEVAGRIGLPLLERPLRPADLERAEEACLVGLPFCLLPVALRGSRTAPGQVAKRLLAAWSEEVGVDLASQTAQLLAKPRRPGARTQTRARTTVVIPARLRSSRLPRKVLADIGGRTMIERVHAAAVRAGCGPVLVLTDDETVADVIRGFGGEVWLTDGSHESGTARIASVASRLSSDVVVNLQGDAPLIEPAVVARAAEEAAASGAAVTMAVYPLDDEADVLDPNVVKVVRGHDGRVLYCSRSAIPFRRDGESATVWGHAGLYAYSRTFLEAFDKLPASALEKTERLEQLRWLEAGVRIHSFAIDRQQPSVDTAADLERIREVVAERLGREQAVPA